MRVLHYEGVEEFHLFTEGSLQNGGLMEHLANEFGTDLDNVQESKNDLKELHDNLIKNGHDQGISLSKGIIHD